jgi:hypothetical protein
MTEGWSEVEKEPVGQITIPARLVGSLRATGECEFKTQEVYQEGTLHEILAPGNGVDLTAEEQWNSVGEDDRRPVGSAGMVAEVDSVELIPRPNPPVKGDPASSVTGPLYKVRLKIDTNGPRISVNEKK